jgi:hypothetical protein
MKKTLFGVVAGLAICTAGVAHADENWHPHCRIAGIEQGINAAITEIKQSPAMGHAGGHYGRAIEDLEKTKRQIREGCRAWMRDHRD